jgi:hypothetical protein
VHDNCRVFRDAVTTMTGMIDAFVAGGYVTHCEYTANH